MAAEINDQRSQQASVMSIWHFQSSTSTVYAVPSKLLFHSRWVPRMTISMRGLRACVTKNRAASSNCRERCVRNALNVGGMARETLPCAIWRRIPERKAADFCGTEGGCRRCLCACTCWGAARRGSNQCATSNFPARFQCKQESLHHHMGGARMTGCP